MLDDKSVQNSNALQSKTLISKTTESRPSHENLPVRNLDEQRQELKELWGQYIHCLDKFGFCNATKDLKRRYLERYREYRREKKWLDQLFELDQGA